MRRVAYYCRATRKDGVGHFVRSSAVVNEATRLGYECAYFVEAEAFVHKLAGRLYSIIHWVNDEQEALEGIEKYNPDTIVIDLLTLREKTVAGFKKIGKLLSLSPVFNHLNSVDMVIHRTRYLDQELISCSKRGALISGLKYSITGDHCRGFDSNDYKLELDEERCSIAIAMGGADAKNKSLNILKALNEVERPLLIWAVMGQGYTHSYDKFVEVSNKSQHEVVIVRSNSSVWRILSNCILAILAGGVTTYEAARVGLPSINILNSSDRRFLIQELEEVGACVCWDPLGDIKLSTRVEGLLNDKETLMQMHSKGKKSIDEFACSRVVEKIHTLWS